MFYDHFVKIIHDFLIRGFLFLGRPAARRGQCAKTFTLTLDGAANSYTDNEEAYFLNCYIDCTTRYPKKIF